MYERLEECPACAHTKLSNYLICKDFSASEESFALVKCERCTLVFTNPRPDSESIGKYYQHDNYISHTNKANNLVNLAYKIVRNITLRQKHQLISSYHSGKTVLDFGCGTGAFLDYLNKKRYQCTGYEPDPDARKMVTDQVTLYQTLNDLEPDHFDIITAWHVIEHVHELKATLKALRKSLKDDGYIFIALPNLNSYDAQTYGEYWAGYDVPRHLYHFSQASFISLANKLKLQHVSTHPMKFDAFYVSMLSEKYKTGHNNYGQAFKVGIKSNRLAKADNNYSSLIYVFKK